MANMSLRRFAGRGVIRAAFLSCAVPVLPRLCCTGAAKSRVLTSAYYINIAWDHSEMDSGEKQP